MSPAVDIAPRPVIVKVPHPIVGEAPPALRKRLKTPFIYDIDFLPVLAGGTVTGSINIEAESDFCVTSAEALVTSTDNLTLIAFPSILIEMKETGSGRTMSNIAVPLISVFGTGAAPAMWWRQMYLQRLRAASTFQISLLNLSATNYNVRLTFAGFKVWDIEEKATDE